MKDLTSPIKLTPEKWCELFEVTIVDPDGWRTPTYQEITIPITEEEFRHRIVKCTVQGRRDGE